MALEHQAKEASMKAMWVSAAAALFVLMAQAPAWSMVKGVPVHHIYGRTIHGIVINNGHRVRGIIIIGIRIGIPPVTKQP
jgi:hypothetical protein